MASKRVGGIDSSSDEPDDLGDLFRAAQPHFDIAETTLRSIESRMPVPWGVVPRFQRGDVDSSDSDCMHETFMSAVAKVRRPQFRMDVRVRKRHGGSQVVFGSSGASAQPKLTTRGPAESFATATLKRRSRIRCSMPDYEEDERAFLHIPKADLTSKKAAPHNPLGDLIQTIKGGTAPYFDGSDDGSVHTDFEFPESMLTTRRVAWDGLENSHSAADSPRVEELKERFVTLQASAWAELRKHSTRNDVAQVRRPHVENGQCISHARAS